MRVERYRCSRGRHMMRCELSSLLEWCNEEHKTAAACRRDIEQRRSVPHADLRVPLDASSFRVEL